MLNFQTRIKFLSQEIIRNHKKKYVDLLADTVLAGERLLIHIEFQSSRVAHYNEKVLDYYWELYKKYRCMIVSIVIYTHGSKLIEPTRFKLERDYLKALHFNFYRFQLKKYYWKDNLSNNPITAALISNMDYNHDERIDMKMKSIEIVEKSNMESYLKALVSYFFDKYITFTLQEKEVLIRKIEKRYGKKGVKFYMEDVSQIYFKHTYEALRKKERKEIIKKFLVKGFSVDVLSEVMEMSKGEVEELKKEVTT